MPVESSGMFGDDQSRKLTVSAMTEPHKRANRHPTYKTAYRVKNWAAYDKALRDRGDITLWLSQEAIDAWTPPQTGKRGAQPVYSDTAIETALTLRLLFGLPQRQAEGFLGSLLRLMDLTLPCPDHTTLSRRNASVAIQRQVDHASQGPIDLIVDSTGLKVCGQDEWHPPETRREEGQTLEETSHRGERPGSHCRLHGDGKSRARPVSSAATAVSSRPCH